jgi:hypothetical protein
MIESESLSQPINLQISSEDMLLNIRREVKNTKK